MTSVQVVTGPTDADEPGQREQLLDVLPGQDRRQRVGAGDEVQIAVRVQRMQVAQRVLGVRATPAVDVDTAHRELRVARGRDHRHQVAVLGGADVAPLLLPWLAGRDEHHLVEFETVGDLARGNQVAVVDGIERPTHHAEPLGAC